MLWTIMALLTVSVVWASVGRIDIVATAQGKIIPSGYSKVIQPYETGVIAAIRVQDGQVVKQG
jgi:hemolysin D